MKNLAILPFLSISLLGGFAASANSAFKNGDTVAYQEGSSRLRVGTVIQKTDGLLDQRAEIRCPRGSVKVQEKNHPSRYGGQVSYLDRQGNFVKSYGVSCVSPHQILKETQDGTYGRDHRYHLGRRYTSGKILYSFENGYVAVVSESAFRAYEQIGENIFRQSPVAMSIGKFVRY
ncbi:MAG: hypothetical protein JST80_13585 [Bdellovibrionales bacterium]|nr:hypothetical protein [Bdellovibrionales bacterium]